MDIDKNGARACLQLAGEPNMSVSPFTCRCKLNGILQGSILFEIEESPLLSLWRSTSAPDAALTHLRHTIQT